jgi:hypothetical protein
MNGDGIDEIWVDGVMVVQEDYLNVVQDAGKGIDGIALNSFLNGDARPVETRMYFDNIVVWVNENDPTYGTRNLHNPNDILNTPVKINK